MRKEYFSLPSIGLLAVLVVAALTACSEQGQSTSLRPSLVRDISAKLVRKSADSGALYVTSESPHPYGGVAVYGGQKLMYRRSITSGIGGPNSLAFNSLGQLFVVNPQGNTVTVYKAGGSRPIRTLSNQFMKNPYRIAISSKNDVYVAAKNWVTIFIGGKQNQSKRIHRKAAAIAIDSSDNFYIGENGVIDVFAPEATKPSRTITQGVGNVSRLAVDASGSLYDSNFQLGSCGAVTVYSAATGTLENTITDGICTPIGLAFDSLGNLYVGNFGSGKGSSVTVYAAGTGSLLETITKGVNNPIAMALDPSDNLYVANQTNYSSSVTVYAPNQTSPSKTLTKGIDYPFDLVWLP
jgi:hypothetical protein